MLVRHANTFGIEPTYIPDTPENLPRTYKRIYDNRMSAVISFCSLRNRVFFYVYIITHNFKKFEDISLVFINKLMQLFKQRLDIEPVQSELFAVSKFVLFKQVTHIINNVQQFVRTFINIIRIRL